MQADPMIKLVTSLQHTGQGDTSSRHTGGIKSHWCGGELSRQYACTAE
jgi:hypothetical protein